jgi:elongation factor Ts
VEVAEGATVGTYVHTNGKIGTIIVLDGGTEDAAKDVAMHAAAMAPEVISPDEVQAEAVEKEKEIWREQLKKEGKPEEMWEKIMMGKEKKFREESALMKQPFVKDSSMSIEKFLNGAGIVTYVRIAI